MNTRSSNEELGTELLSLLSSSYDGNRIKDITSVLQRVVKNRPRLTLEKVAVIEKKVIESIDYLPEHTTISALICLMIPICCPERVSGYTKVVDYPSVGNKPLTPESRYTLSYRFDLLQKAGVFDSNEETHYFDGGYFHFGNRFSSRVGSLVITDKRIVLMGARDEVHYGSGSVYRLYYDDMASRPYLLNVDYLDYDKIHDFKLHWGMRKKHIEISYSTKYVEFKGRVFHGPLFFKKELPPDVTIETGPLRIDILLMDSDPGEPDKKSRYEKIEKYVRRFL